MYDSYSFSSLSSLNECDLRPKRTSYQTMSTWFIMKNSSHGIDTYTEVNDEFVKERPLPPSKPIALPPLKVIPFKLRDENINNGKEAESQLIQEIFMRNWKEKREVENSDEKTWNRVGRGGGVWNNVREALQNDGNRRLFIHGAARSYKGLQRNNSTMDFGSYVREYPEPLRNPNARLNRQLSVQTREAVERGNWNMTR